MKESTTYSIGHGNKKIEEFIKELKSFEIDYLLDLRSKPYSKWNPHFNQNDLKAALQNEDIKYVFVGHQLGGLPDDNTCYDAHGKVVYDQIRDKEFFKQGIERLIKADRNKNRIALMCSEAKPSECHRSKLIGKELQNHQIELLHIVGPNKLKSQNEVINEFNKGLNETDLFGNSTKYKSRKSY